MIKKLDNILASNNFKIIDVVKKIKKNGQGACFITNTKKKLLGIMTDGDIRKLLIKNISTEKKITNYYNKNVFKLSVNEPSEKIYLHLKKGIKIIPLINLNNEVVDFVSRTKNKNIPLVKPDLGGNELPYLIDCLKSSFISSKGKYVNLFEKKFKDYYKAKYSLSVSNCTCGLILALKSLNLKPNDEVIVPNVTFISPINAVIHVNAKPVLCDIDEDTFTLNIKSLKKLVNRNTKAIICVHTYGHPCDMSAILKITKNKNIKIIEDCAEGIGTKYKRKDIGNFGDFAVFSFFGNKSVTTGEGGMILFKNKVDYEKCYNLRDHGMNTKKKYWHDQVGFNFRMTNMQAALGVAQMEKIQYIIKEKIKIANFYNKYLKNCNLVELPIEKKWATHSYWLYNIILKNEIANKRPTIMKRLEQAGIEVRPMFYPASDMKIYKNFVRSKNISKISYRGISLPSYVGLAKNDIKFITNNIKKILDSF